MQNRKTWVLVALASSLAISCTVNVETGYFATKADGEETVALFHQRFSQQRYGDIYDTAAQVFRASSPRDAIVSRMRADREKYGEFVSAEQKGAFCELLDVELWYHSVYTLAKVTEHFRCHKRGPNAELVAYQAFMGHVEPRPEIPKSCP